MNNPTKTLLSTALLMCLAQAAISGGGPETIKVSKCYSTMGETYSQLLIKASSSDQTAHLYAYLPSGAYLGELRNGGGSRYGGDVFITYSNPASITIRSSGGAVVVAPTTPFQP